MTYKIDSVDIVDYGSFVVPQTLDNTMHTIAPFDHEIGKKYFINSSFKNAFFKLAPHYIPQQHITTCGIASAIIVLNTIYRDKQLKKPLDQNGSLYIDETNQCTVPINPDKFR